MSYYTREHAPLMSASWVVSAVRSLDANLTLVTSLRRAGYTGRIAVASEDPEHCARLSAAGADVTVQPLHIAAVPLLDRILAHDEDLADADRDEERPDEERG